jgi:hypothetical protein
MRRNRPPHRATEDMIVNEDLESPGSLSDLPSLPELPEGPSSRSQAVSCSDVGSLNFVPATVIDLDEK